MVVRFFQFVDGFKMIVFVKVDVGRDWAEDVIVVRLKRGVGFLVISNIGFEDQVIGVFIGRFGFE